MEQVLGLLGTMEPHLFKALFFIWRCCRANIVVPEVAVKERGLCLITRGVGGEKRKKFSRVTG